jgi:hypothetical protein
MKIKAITPERVEIQRFAAKIALDSSGCHMWTGVRNAKGYGRFRIDGALHMAHRVAFVLAGGELSPDRVIDHLCRNASCVNPDHLEAVTTQENTARGNAGINTASRTHCPQGHEYTAENTLLSVGRRHCRACRTGRRAAAARRARDRYQAARTGEVTP